MVKRDAQARSEVLREGTPATLSSAAEEHAQALKQQLLETTELAAKTMVGQTRAEGERRIEVAGRQAQAIAATVSAVQQAEQALNERAKAFAEASRALRSELKAFAETLSDGEKQLSPQAAEEPELRLVESPAPTAPHQPVPSDIGQILLAGEVEELEDESRDEGDEDHRPEEEPDDDDEDEDAPEEVEEPPTQDQIARIFRQMEAAEVARADRLEREPRGRPGVGERFAMAAWKPSRDRLYTDIGGAVIGLGGAAALLNFVLLK
jgi:hypothetical protein